VKHESEDHILWCEQGGEVGRNSRGSKISRQLTERGGRKIRKALSLRVEKSKKEWAGGSASSMKTLLGRNLGIGPPACGGVCPITRKR